MDLLKKEKKTKKTPHEQIIDITRPAYLFGLWGGVITLMVSVLMLIMLVTYRGTMFGQGVITFFEIVMLAHLLIGVLMLISVYLIRKEHHCFGGSVLLLCASIIGLAIASGLFIGPILGVTGGIMGMAEHEKLIRKHLD